MAYGREGQFLRVSKSSAGGLSSGYLLTGLQFSKQIAKAALTQQSNGPKYAVYP